MKTIFKWIFEKTSLGRLINGNKTFIGFSMLAVASLVSLLAQAMTVFPELSWITTLHAYLTKFEVTINPILNSLGITVGSLGLVHKEMKK